MVDQRELILARLVVVCGAVNGIVTAARNRLDVAKLQRPAVVVLDGVETRLDGAKPHSSEKQRMELTPAVAIHVLGNDPIDGGGLLSLYRGRVLSAVLNDATLLSYVSINGGIRYDGAAVALPAAEGREYRLDLSIVFTYPFSLGDLA